MTAREPWTVGKLLTASESYLRGKGVQAPRLDAEILLAHVLEVDRVRLYMEYHEPVEPEERARYREVVRRRARGEPSAYIVGRRMFWTLDLEVTPDVMIPRPETEHVVEAALDALSSRDEPLRVVDVGTGSGNIAIALAKELPRATILAVDISGPAVAVARRNAERCGVSARVETSQGDLLEPAGRKGWRGQVDLIVSNPPYIRPGDRETLPREVRAFEPDLALFDRADGDGLGIHRRILREGVEYLRPRGVVVLELAAGLAGRAAELFEAFGYRLLSVRRDLSGVERVAVARPEGSCEGPTPVSDVP